METFYDIGTNDLKELWDNDLDPAMEEALDGESDMNDWFCRDTKSGVVLHDRLMTDAALGTLPIKTEHSYSLNSDGDSPTQSPRDMHSRVDDMEDECFPAIPLRNAWSGGGGVCTRRSPPSPAPSRTSIRTMVKTEPLSRPGSPCSQASSCPDSPSPAPSPAPTSPQHLHLVDYVIDHTTGNIHLPHGTLRRGTPLLLSSPGVTNLPKLNIKLEPNTSGFGLPPTPPSSLSSEDSEGGHSPSPPPASQATPGPRSRTTHIYTPTHHQRQPIHTPLISSQPKGSTGTLELTDEEKRTLLAEGYPVPTRLPLTKTEEKSLKKIRRKIKNKISAQESRRKKKEYMDQLERKVEILAGENTDYRKRVESLEQSNANLLNQLAILQATMSRVTRK